MTYPIQDADRSQQQISYWWHGLQLLQQQHIAEAEVLWAKGTAERLLLEMPLAEAIELLSSRMGGLILDESSQPVSIDDLSREGYTPSILLDRIMHTWTEGCERAVPTSNYKSTQATVFPHVLQHLEHLQALSLSPQDSDLAP